MLYEFPCLVSIKGDIYLESVEEKCSNNSDYDEKDIHSLTEESVFPFYRPIVDEIERRDSLCFLSALSFV